MKGAKASFSGQGFVAVYRPHLLSHRSWPISLHHHMCCMYLTLSYNNTSVSEIHVLYLAAFFDWSRTCCRHGILQADVYRCCVWVIAGLCRPSRSSLQRQTKHVYMHWVNQGRCNGTRLTFETVHRRCWNRWCVEDMGKWFTKPTQWITTLCRDLEFGPYMLLWIVSIVWTYKNSNPQGFI